MASTGGRRRPQKYPDELRERAVRMVLEVRQQTGEKHGAVTRQRRSWASARSRCEGGSTVPRSTRVAGRARRRPTRSASHNSSARTASYDERTTSSRLHRFSSDRARRSSEEVVAFIDAHRGRDSGGLRWGVEPICHVSEIAPTTYWSAKTRPLWARARRDAMLGPMLEALLVKNYSVYGRRKLTRAADGPGIDMGRDQVARLMRAAGIRGASRASSASPPTPTRPRAAPRISSGVTSPPPARMRSGSPTSRTALHGPGSSYVAFVTDVFSRRIVGWKASRPMTTALVVDVLNMAAWISRGVNIDGVVCHSDAGSQYISIAYTDRLAEIGAAPSIGTIGDCFDNAMAETTIGLFKTELHRNPPRSAANGGHWHGLDDLETATCGWVGWFNEERFHGELDDLTPAEFEAAYYLQQSQPDAA